MMRARTNALLLSWVALSAPVSCKKNESNAATSASAAPSALAPLATAPAPNDTRPAGLTPAPAIARQTLSDTPPPLKPPATARTGALGLSYETVSPGTGPELTPGADILCELRAWDASQRMLTDTTKQPTPFAFGVEGLPGELREEFARQRTGAHLRVWMPGEATSRLRLAEWPAGAALRLELKILGVRERSAPREFGAGAVALPPSFEPPAASGPPATAKTTPNGVRHVWLASGPEGRQPKESDTVRLKLTAHSVEGVLVSTVVRDRATTLAFASTPAGLKSILVKMVPGDTVRAWLPPALAREVVPQVSASAVVDVTLEGFQ